MPGLVFDLSLQGLADTGKKAGSTFASAAAHEARTASPIVVRSPQCCADVRGCGGAGDSKRHITHDFPASTVFQIRLRPTNGKTGLEATAMECYRMAVNA
jgi:hypothetical protein